MAMILKHGKDHSKVKGWGPAVLANTVGKLAEKLIAEVLQEQRDFWHDMCARQFTHRSLQGEKTKTVTYKQILAPVRRSPSVIIFMVSSEA